MLVTWDLTGSHFKRYNYVYFNNQSRSQEKDSENDHRSFSKISHLSFNLCVYACVSVYVPIHACALRVQVLLDADVIINPLGLQLKAVGTCLAWLLGTKFRSSSRAAHGLNY